MCYCCSEKTVKIIMIVLGALIVIPGIILFILGGLFAKDIKVIAGDGGGFLGNVAAAISYLFGALVIWIGGFTLLIGICMNKCEKLASCCAVFFTIKSVLWFLAFLILGIVFLAISSIGVRVVDAVCDPTLSSDFAQSYSS